MPKRPKRRAVESRAKGKYSYDLEQTERIVQAMDFLRKEAVKTRIPEIVTMVDSTFHLLLTSYYCILRYEMQKLSGTDETVQ
jgi:hypothetical protein